MVRILMIIGLFACITAGATHAEKTSMVDRHIFLPENAADQKEDVPVAAGPTVSALEKEIQFTGVLLTPKGKQAVISESVKNDKLKLKRPLKEGDQIKGMTIKEIGSNYVLLATKENTVRLDLYKGAKIRPTPAPEPVKVEPNTLGNNPPNLPKPGMSADAQQPATSKNDTKAVNVNPGQALPVDKEGGSPFGGAKTGKTAQDNSGSGNTGSAVNPFAEILKTGAERRNQSGADNAAGALPFNLPGMNP